MQDMSDKEFDEFFKKAADQYQIPYNQRSWDKMRTKLDRGGGTVMNTGRKIILSVGLLLLLGVVAVWMYLGTPLSPETTKDNTDHQENTMADKDAQDAPLVTPDTQGTLEYRKKLPSQEASQIAATRRSQQATPSLPDDRKEIPAKASAQTSSESKQKSNLAQDDSSASLYTQINPYETYQYGYLSGQGWAPLSALWTSPSITLPEWQPVKTQGVYEVIKKDKRASPFHRVALSFSVSPDLSAIQLADMSQVGMKSGIGLEFFLFRRVSLQTGIVFSHKVYSATEGYQAPYGYWYYNNKPTRIDATCNVLDIPVNLRYYAFQWEKSRLFVSTGLSSYLMLKEDYQYQYYSYDPKQLASHQARNKNQHYFKVANFSVGFERKLGRLWALQAEPFIKSPMAGVGEGKVKLSTAGIFMTIKYNLGRIPSGN